MNTELDVLAECGIKLVELLPVLGNLVEQLQSLLDDIFLYHLHDLVLLEGLTRQIERQIFRIDNTLHETEPLRNEVSRVVGNENTADVELDVILSLLSLKEIERSALGNE